MRNIYIFKIPSTLRCRGNTADSNNGKTFFFKNSKEKKKAPPPPHSFTFSININFLLKNVKILQNRNIFSLWLLYMHPKFYVGPAKLQVFNESTESRKNES